MIRTESEYQRTLQQLEQDRQFIQKQREHLDTLGLTSEQLERALHPTLSFHRQLEEEAESYENIRRGEFGTLRNLNSLGRWLIGARIAKGWSQKELAQRLGVSEAQVSRDERNEYHGIKVDRAQAILEAMDFQFAMNEDGPAAFSSGRSAGASEAAMFDFDLPVVPPTEIPSAISGYLRAHPKLDREKAESLSKAFTQLFEEEVVKTKGEG